MTSWCVLRARAVWVFGIGLVLAGLLPVLYFIALVWQSRKPGSEFLDATLTFVDRSLLGAAKVGPVLDFLPEFPSAWITGLQTSLVLAVLGVVLTALGVLIARRKRAAIRREEWQRQDRLRRVQRYRDNGRSGPFDSSRLEPFIGPDIATGTDAEPFDSEGAQHQRHDARHVA